MGRDCDGEIGLSGKPVRRRLDTGDARRELQFDKTGQFCRRFATDDTRVASAPADRELGS